MTDRGNRHGYCEGCWSCDLPCDKMTDEFIDQLIEEHREMLDELAKDD